jgi:hypothetical protein
MPSHTERGRAVSDLLLLLVTLPLTLLTLLMVGKRSYPVGHTVKFMDDSATVPENLVGERMVLAEGLITGEPVETIEGVLVPVWANRDGDIATTVYVNEDNILDVTRGKFP